MERFSRRQFITGGAVAAFGGTRAIGGWAPPGAAKTQSTHRPR